MSENDNRPGFAYALSTSVLLILLVVPTFAEPAPSAVEAALDAAIDAMADASPDGDGNAGSDAETENETGTSSSAQDSSAGSGITSALSKLSIHGFLTQAYAEADFVDIPVGQRPEPPFGPGGVGPLGDSPEGNEVSLGIPEGGTTNYRFLALQFRYDMSLKDTFVVQLSSRTLGFSPIQDFEDEIELDWAFYERRLTDQASLKVGRVQIPFGIYNEVRDVGTILPFYRPAFVRYKEGAFTSETVDGLSLGTTFFPDSEWSLDVTGYAGEWQAIQFTPGDATQSGIVEVEDGYGYQIWLNTPLSDLRIGTGLISFKQRESPIALQARERRDIFHASLDATFGRFVLQAEWDNENTDISLGGLDQTIDATDWYVLAGVRATDKFHIWGQLERGEFTLTSPAFLRDLDWVGREDLGISLNYFFAPNLVLKAEHHWVEADVFNFFPDFSAGVLLLRPETARATDGRYSIVALSVSF